MAKTQKLGPLLMLVLVTGWIEGQSASGPTSVREIPLVEEAPQLEEFLDMQAPARLEGRLAVFSDFRQRQPQDGTPATERSEAFLCHDQENLYVVWVLHDSSPDGIRARMTRRDNLAAASDDFVELTLDTFQDQRRGIVFSANPFGVQQDGLWFEGPRPGGGLNQTGGTLITSGGIGRLANRGVQQIDRSFDTVWSSRGQLTEQGYVVWMAIPFKSLRFPDRSGQSWGMTLQRSIARNNESSFWPHVSDRLEGRLNQAATIHINQAISPGRNLQLIPFGVFQSVRALDSRDSSRPAIVTDSGDLDAGLDAKIVFKDSLVLDLALNPDFSQVESDQPQATANERFEVRFPEKRPFFLENSNFFSTPINLVFTRRIVDPRLGARLSGKLGPWAIGGLVMDDESPGKSVPEDDPLSGSRALFSIVRVSRDLGNQSSLGFIFTNREHESDTNRVGGVDGRWKLNQNWVATFQAVSSSTNTEKEGLSAGPAYLASLTRRGRQLQHRFEYSDISPGFETEPGFVRRKDFRRLVDRVAYTFRPEKTLVLWEAIMLQEGVWDHAGTRLDYEFSPRINLEFVGQTRFGFNFRRRQERLRPEDFSALTENKDFGAGSFTLAFSSDYLSSLGVAGRVQVGNGINFDPPDGGEPFPADRFRSQLALTLRPTTQIRVDNTYLYQFLGDKLGRGTIFNNHIFRTRWNWQFTQELSFRTILQYESVLANSALTELETEKSFDIDLLFTFLINPWTVLYVGYNSGYQNLDLIEDRMQNALVRTRDLELNDAQQFFVKFQYLFRF